MKIIYQKLYWFILYAVTPISKIMGRMRFSPKARDIRASDYIALLQCLAKGDVILSYSKGELTNEFIEGEYKHCGIYYGDGYLYEAIGKGVSRTSLEDFCASKDKIAVCRAIFCDEEEAWAAAEWAKTQEGKPYDYRFQPTEDAFYCAEYVAKAFMVAKHENSPFVPREIMGVQTVLPSDFKLATKKFKIIMERPIKRGT